MIILLVVVGYGLSQQHAVLQWWRELLAHRAAAVAVALLTFAAFWSVRHFERDPAAVIGDEASYKLQANLFAAGRWTDTVPNPREPFRQMYVLDETVTASKYPPGHALVLAPGFRLGFPFLAPLVAGALAGMLIFLIGRKLFHAEAGLAAWLSWLGSVGPLKWGITWFSESTSGVLMLAGWWLVLRKPMTNRHALILGAITGWLAITRPLTAVTFVLPIAVMMLVEAWRGRTAMRIVCASAAALPSLVLLPIWSWQTTGNPRLTPLESYTARHLPIDRVGFGAPNVVAPVPLVDDQADVEAGLVRLHQKHTPATYLPHMVERLRVFLVDHTPGRSPLLYLVVVVGMLLLPAWMIATLALQYAAYGLYAHGLDWNLYYEELGPLAALGIAAAITFVLKRRTTEVRSATWGVVTVLLVATAFSQLIGARQEFHAREAEVRAYREATRELAAGSIVFVQYAERHNMHHAVVTNLAPWADQKLLTAYDRGTMANREVASRTGRTGYLYREQDGSLQPLSAADTSSGFGAAPTAP